MDHARLFKELLTTFFAEFVALFLPQVRGYVEPGSFEFFDKEVFTDVTAGERHEADLVVKARFQRDGWLLSGPCREPGRSLVRFHPPG